MRLERRLNGPNHVIGAVLTVQADVVTQHGTGTNVDDDEKPDAFDLEFLFKTQRITDHDFETDIKPVTVKFNNIKNMQCRRRIRGDIRRQPFEMGRAGKSGSALERLHAAVVGIAGK